VSSLFSGGSVVVVVVVPPSVAMAAIASPLGMALVHWWRNSVRFFFFDITHCDIEDGHVALNFINMLERWQIIFFRIAELTMEFEITINKIMSRSSLLQWWRNSAGLCGRGETLG
jgi:hypothetical protein